MTGTTAGDNATRRPNIPIARRHLDAPKVNVAPRAPSQMGLLKPQPPTASSAVTGNAARISRVAVNPLSKTLKTNQLISIEPGGWLSSATSRRKSAVPAAAFRRSYSNGVSTNGP